WGSALKDSQSEGSIRRQQNQGGPSVASTSPPALPGPGWALGESPSSPAQQREELSYVPGPCILTIFLRCLLQGVRSRLSRTRILSGRRGNSSALARLEYCVLPTASPVSALAVPASPVHGRSTGRPRRA